MKFHFWEELFGKRVKIKDLCLNTVEEYKVIGMTHQTVMLEGLDGSKYLKNKKDCFLLSIEEDGDEAEGKMV
jgi:hypothetical protein